MYSLGPNYIAVRHARSQSALLASNVHHIKVAHHIRHTRKTLHGENKPEDLRGKNMGKAARNLTFILSLKLRKQYG